MKGVFGFFAVRCTGNQNNSHKKWRIKQSTILLKIGQNFKLCHLSFVLDCLKIGTNVGYIVHALHITSISFGIF